MEKQYLIVPQDERDIGEKDTFERPPPYPHRSALQGKRITGALFFLLIVSLGANVFFVDRQYLRPWSFCDKLPTRFAGLTRTVPASIAKDSDFSSVNRTIQDAAWGAPDSIPWSGFVALEESFASVKGLPHAQRWPWDFAKGVYILQSAHELHCLHVLRSSINEYHDEGTQTWYYGHVLHCLNVLRESVMCNADDTPLYTGHLNGNKHTSEHHAGTGGVRMCRDWHALQDWGRARSACFNPVHWFDEDFNELERYKFCPDGAQPWLE